MATETLAVNLLLNAGQYKREAREASTATGKIASSAGAAGTATGKLGTQMGVVASTAKFAIAGAATAAVVGFARDSVRAATDLGESINAVNVVFGDAAEGIHAIGESAADSFGMAQSEFNQFAVRFSAFAKNIAQRDGRSVVEVVDEMTARVADFASVHNLSLERAAEVAQSTMAGETEVFRRFGGDVSAAAVQAKLLEEGIIEVGESASEQEKILGRYMLFMEQTADTAGDFANTQDDLANATRTLSANFEDFKARAGAGLTPVLADLAKAGTNLFDIFDSDVNLGWTQRLSAAFQLLEDQSGETVTAYVEQKSALNDLAEVGMKPITEETAALVEVTEESIGAANRHRGAIDNLSGSFEDLNDADLGAIQQEFIDTGLSIDEATEAAKLFEAQLRRLTDPAFKALDNQRKFNEAVEALEEARAKGDPDELAVAIENAGQAYIDARESAAEFNRQDLDDVIGAMEATLFAAGATDDEVQLLTEHLRALDGGLSVYEIEANFRASGSAAAREAIERGGGFSQPTFTTTNRRQHGGPVSRNTPYLIGERGPELFIPSQSGTIVSNSQMNATTGGMVSGPTYNVFTLTWGDFVRKAYQAGVDINRLGW